MQYGQIVFLLFIALLFYYAALIVLDIMKAKAAQAAELESQSEEDIDISDEAKTFKPFRISREETEAERAWTGGNRQIPTLRQNQTGNNLNQTLGSHSTAPASVKPS